MVGEGGWGGWGAQGFTPLPSCSKVYTPASLHKLGYYFDLFPLQSEILNSTFQEMYELLAILDFSNERKRMSVSYKT